MSNPATYSSNASGRSVKYEDVYRKGDERVPELTSGLRAYVGFHNAERWHQSLGDRTPAEVYGVGAKTP